METHPFFVTRPGDNRPDSSRESVKHSAASESIDPNKKFVITQRSCWQCACEEEYTDPATGKRWQYHPRTEQSRWMD
eukprot:1155286-Amphidinium_carterae.1